MNGPCRCAVLLAAAAMLLPAQMSGPEGSGPDPEKLAQMRAERLARMLALTEEQKAQALRIFADAQSAAERYQQEMQVARQALHTAIRANDVAAMDRAARDIGAAMAELTSIDARAEAAFYALLTPEQKAEYDSMPGRGPLPGGGGPGRTAQAGPAQPNR